jgi:DNA-binding MarR family transcriptional regulator
MVMADIYLSEEILELWRLFARTNIFMRKIREKELESLNTNVAQLLILDVIHKLGGSATSIQISNYIYRKRHTIHEVLRRMEKVGLINMERIPNTKNRVKAVLTAKGYRIYCLASEKKILYSLIASLSKEQRNQLRECLIILYKGSLKELKIVERSPLAGVTTQLKK